MKQRDVQVGRVYAVKVSERLSPVKLVREHSRGGWYGLNLRTGREIWVRSAQRLRYELEAYVLEDPAFAVEDSRRFRRRWRAVTSEGGPR